MIAIGFTMGAGLDVAAPFVRAVANAIGSASPSWRHMLFAVIDGVMAWSALARPPLAAVALPLPLAQQLSAHGAHAWQVWAADCRMDWPSVAVMAFLVYACAAIWTDLLRRRMRYN